MDYWWLVLGWWGGSEMLLVVCWKLECFYLGGYWVVGIMFVWWLLEVSLVGVVSFGW